MYFKKTVKTKVYARYKRDDWGGYLKVGEGKCVQEKQVSFHHFHLLEIYNSQPLLKVTIKSELIYKKKKKTYLLYFRYFAFQLSCYKYSSWQ